MSSRRTFLKALGLGISAFRDVKAAKTRFVLGIGTYTYRGVTLEEMIDHLTTLKIRQIELSNPEYFLPAVKLNSVPSLRAKLDRAGITPLSYFCGDIKTEADLELTIQVSRRLGVNHVSGSAVGDALKMIEMRFNREGLKFGIHNHWFRGRKFEYESPDDVLRAVEDLTDTVGATLDTGHMASCGYDPVKSLTKLQPRLQVVHLKDVERAGDDKNVVLGTGVAKSVAVIDELKRQGFPGLVAIEYEAMPQNPQPDVKRCVDFARKWM